MRDLRSGWLIWTKAILFLLIGLSSSVLILVELPSLQIFVLLCLAIWSFCRAYYFAFYVIERYLDPSFRYSGLFSVIRHLVASRARSKETEGR